MVVVAVTFAQLGQMARGGRRLLPGGLGLCAIPTLALLAGTVVGLMASPRTGVAAGLAAVVLLSAVRRFESRFAAGPA